MASTRTKYKELNLKEKYELIKFLEKHSERKAAEYFGISKTTVNNIRKRKSEYLNRYEMESPDTKRKRRVTEFDEINKLTYNWVLQMKRLNARISGPMLQETALKFAEKLNLPHFKASTGWLESFKIRNNISSITPTRETDKFNHTEADTEDFNAQFSELLVGYTIPENVLDHSESGSVFRTMADCSFSAKGDPCESVNLSKKHLTILPEDSAIGEKFLNSNSRKNVDRAQKDCRENIHETNNECSDENESCINEIKKTSLTPEEVTGMLEEIVSGFALEKCPEMLAPLYEAKRILANAIYNKYSSFT